MCTMPCTFLPLLWTCVRRGCFFTSGLCVVCAGVSICNGAEACSVGGPAKGGGGEEERGPVGQCRPGETDADGGSGPGKT